MVKASPYYYLLVTLLRQPYNQSIYIRTVSYVLASVIYSAKPVKTSLWAIWEEQHVQYNWFVPNTSQEELNMSNIYTVPITRIVVKVLRKIPKPEYHSHIHKWPRGLYLTECTMYRSSKSLIMGSNSYWSRIDIFLFFSQPQSIGCKFG